MAEPMADIVHALSRQIIDTLSGAKRKRKGGFGL